MTSDPTPLTVVAGHPRGSALAITVVPRASRTVIEAMADGSLRVRIAAPPIDGAANAALLRFLADVLDVPRSRLEIASGASGRRKRIVVDGMAPDVLRRHLQDALGTGNESHR